MAKYEVSVGNIGTVHQGRNLREARRVKAVYVAQSQTGRGRAGGEDVILWKDSEPMEEFTGSLNDWEARDGDE